MGIGLRLKTILRDQKMTIKQLSEKSDISINTLYSITKRDSESMDPVILQRISDALGVSVESLYGKEEIDNLTMGIRIQRARESANLTQKELAEKIDIPVFLIEQYENDSRHPKTETLFRIAEALNVNPRELGHDHTFFFSDYAFLDGEENSVKVQQGSYLTGTEIPLVSAFRKLNDDGKKKAVERVEELTEIQKYQARKEEISEVLSDLMPDSPNIRENLISALARLPDEGLPIIAEYIVSMCKDPKAYLEQTDEERAADTKRLAEQMIKAIEEHKSEE